MTNCRMPQYKYLLKINLKINYNVHKYLRKILYFKKFLITVEKLIINMPARDEAAERNLECNHCGRLFRFKWQLSEHTRRHENKTPYKCNLCSKAFVKNSDLTTHLRSHSDEKLFNCQYCARPFKSRQGKLFHEDSHGFNSYECPKCKENFQSYWKLLKHKKTHYKSIAVKNGERPISSFKCSYCLVTFSTLEFKLKHEETVHKKRAESNTDTARRTKKPKSEIRPFKRKFNNKSLISESIKIPPFSCSACAQTFPGSTSLSNHIKAEHPGEKLFHQQCNLCKKNISFNYFRSHIMSHYNIRPFVCKICDAKFVRNHDLQHHLTIHSNLTPFECTECHQKFQSIKCLAQHKKYHHSILVHSCNICGKTFKKETSLKGHVMRIHCKAENTVMCHMCNIEVFSSDLNNHNKRHHDNEKQLCEICGSSFKNLWTYKYHLKACNNANKEAINSIDLMPVKAITVVPCPHCSYLSANASVFKRHCLKFHAEKVFNCIICSKKFIDKRKYKIHLKKHNIALNYVNDVLIYECCFCGFIPTSFIALIEHWHSHEYFKWSLSWKRPNANFNVSNLRSNENYDFLYPSNDSSSLEIKNTRNPFNLIISIKDEISWIHDTPSKDNYRIQSQSLNYKSSTNCSSKITNQNSTQQNSCKSLPATKNYDCKIEDTANEVQTDFTDTKPPTLLKSKDQFGILQNCFINKNEESCSERPFVYVDDLKKLNITTLKKFLKNL